MSLIRLLIVLLAIPMFMADVAVSFSAETKANVDQDQAVRVDQVLQQAVENDHIPGISVAVIREGKMLLAKGYGQCNVELQVPVTPETVFQIQSITKSFTSTGVMLLAEERKISPEDLVSVHLQGTPDIWKDITIRHLLCHTSGIKDFINEPTASLRLDKTEEQVFLATISRPLNFTPGEKYAYSNTNYHLLAMIIRKLTGKSYGDFLQEKIFQPLGMENTKVISWSEIIPHRSAGYHWTSEGLRNGDFIAPSILGYGGGGLRSTVLDMVKWDAALDAGQVLKKSSLEQVWTPTKLNDGSFSNYGFGWVNGSKKGHRHVSHTGGHSTGFSTAFIRFVDDRLTVVLFCNRSGIKVSQLAMQVAEIFLPETAGE